MSQSVTPSQIKFGYECFYRCDNCYRNVYENYQWLNLVALAKKNEQDDSKCPYCNALIDFDLSAIDKPSGIIPPILRFPGKKYSFVLKTDQSILTTVTITVKGTIGENLEINWGDKNKTITLLTGANQTITHNYTIVGNYYILIFCKTNILTKFEIRNSALSSHLPSPDVQSSLQYLYFDRNNFSGTIPPLSTLTSLIQLYIYSNSLTGSIPSLTNLTLLQRLYINNNNLSGSIPSLSANAALRYVLMNGNNFTGTIPSLDSLTNLITLYLFSNNLTGTIPSLSNNTNLNNFRIYSNNITGTIPSLSNNTNIKWIYVHSNQITNYTASTLSSTLIYFWAHNNQLPSSAVNQILADFVTNLASRPAVGNIYLHGTGNQAPTGQGIIDKTAIIAHGWSVITN